ncbi:hypothetical protein DFP72DRAFT_572253 [Ephemerocybe angulata]|uniref:Uncharacterized protein n=1 Tax=Ephemerocybe angulata TaxID=980116 RepID=A0A8H6LZB4_9AGAR|nr:hypothetical protein DFP72DRAFT_572253 [Tulosesus angulatus]
MVIASDSSGPLRVTYPDYLLCVTDLRKVRVNIRVELTQSARDHIRGVAGTQGACAQPTPNPRNARPAAFCLRIEGHETFGPIGNTIAPPSLSLIRLPGWAHGNLVERVHVWSPIQTCWIRREVCATVNVFTYIRQALLFNKRGRSSAIQVTLTVPPRRSRGLHSPAGILIVEPDPKSPYSRGGSNRVYPFHQSIAVEKAHDFRTTSFAVTYAGRQADQSNFNLKSTSTSSQTDERRQDLNDLFLLLFGAREASTVASPPTRQLTLSHLAFFLPFFLLFLLSSSPKVSLRPPSPRPRALLCSYYSYLHPYPT